jgi:hypothetical protein
MTEFFEAVWGVGQSLLSWLQNFWTSGGNLIQDGFALSVMAMLSVWDAIMGILPFDVLTAIPLPEIPETGVVHDAFAVLVHLNMPEYVSLLVTGLTIRFLRIATWVFK